MKSKKTHTGKQTYSDDLKLLKSSFDDNNEYSHILEQIVTKFRPRQLRILDVGCGSGKLLHWLADQLHPLGYSVIGTGLDLNASDTISQSKNIQLVKGDFRTYYPEMTYDLVLAVQSLYYLGSPKVAIERLLTFCNQQNGMLAVIMWSESCTLYKIALRLCELSDQSIMSGEEVFREIKNIFPHCATSKYHLHHAVKISEWLSAPAVGNAALRVISRLVDPGDLPIKVCDIPQLVGIPNPDGWLPRENVMITISTPI